MSAYCLHRLIELPKPWRPSARVNGRPWRYQCEKCRLHFKIATGLVVRKAGAA